MLLLNCTISELKNSNYKTHSIDLCRLEQNDSQRDRYHLCQLLSSHVEVPRMTLKTSSNATVNLLDPAERARFMGLALVEFDDNDWEINLLWVELSSRNNNNKNNNINNNNEYFLLATTGLSFTNIINIPLRYRRKNSFQDIRKLSPANLSASSFLVVSWWSRNQIRFVDTATFRHIEFNFTRRLVQNGMIRWLRTSSFWK